MLLASNMLISIVSASYLIVSMALIRDISSDSSVLVAIAPLFRTLSSVTLGLIAGYIIDRFGARKIMVVSTLLTSLSLCVMAISTRVYLIYVMLFLTSTFLVVFYRPANNAFIPAVIKSEELLRVNSILRALSYVNFIVMPTLMGVLAEKYNPHILFYAMVLISLASILPLIFIKIQEEKNPCLSTRLSEIFDGFEYLFRERAVVTIFLLYMLVMLTTGGINIALNMFVLEELKMGISIIGVLTSIFTGGLILGNFFLGFLKKVSKGRVVTIGILLTGLGYIILSVSSSLLLIFILQLLLGLFASFIVTPSMTVFQEVVPSNLRGRVFSGISIFLGLSTLISSITVSVLINFINSRSIIFACGMITFLLGGTNITLGKLRKRLYKPH